MPTAVPNLSFPNHTAHARPGPFARLLRIDHVGTGPVLLEPFGSNDVGSYTPENYWLEPQKLVVWKIIRLFNQVIFRVPAVKISGVYT